MVATDATPASTNVTQPEEWNADVALALDTPTTDLKDTGEATKCWEFGSVWGGGTRPPLVSNFDIMASGLLSFIGIGALSLIRHLVEQTCSLCTELDVVQVVGSFGASAVLLFGAPAAPFSQPRNLILGHLIAALVGVGVYTAIAEPMGSTTLAAPVSVSLSIMLMHACGVLHPPAGGTALIAVLGSPRMHDMGLLWVAAPIMTSASLMLLIATGGNYLLGRKYPNYWLGEPAASSPGG